MQRRVMVPKVIASLALMATPLLVACGGSEGGGARSPREVARDDEGGSSERRGAPAVESEIGALDEDKVDKVFGKTLGSLQRCLDQGSRRVEFIGGSVSFFIKVDGDGQLSHAHLERSTIGDRDTEKCMLDVLAKRPWPKPVGGESGFARKSFEFDPPNDVRPPADLSEDFVSEALDGKLSMKIDECKNGTRGRFTATMYVDTEGAVLAVGVTPPDEGGESAVDCLVDALKQATFPSPGSWPGKISFAL